MAKPKMSKDLQNTIRDLYKSGKSASYISWKVGISVSSIYIALGNTNRHNKSKPMNSRKQIEHEEILANINLLHKEITRLGDTMLNMNDIQTQQVRDDIEDVQTVISNVRESGRNYIKIAAFWTIVITVFLVYILLANHGSTTLKQFGS